MPINTHTHTHTQQKKILELLKFIKKKETNCGSQNLFKFIYQDTQK